MESCQDEHEEISDIGDKDDQIGNRFPRKPFWIQLMVCAAVCFTFLTSGLCLGAPTVIVPQLRRDNSTPVSEETASWLSTSFSISVIPWNIILPLLASRLGRRKSYIFVCVAAITGFIIFYYASTIAVLFVSYAVLGPMFAAISSLLLVSITEYTSPKNRGMFLAMKSVSFYYGMWVSNALGTYFHWTYIPLFGFICSILVLIIVTFIPESPYWLASKGKLNKCAKSHRWLRGTDDVSEKELEGLLKLVRDKMKSKSSGNTFMTYVRIMFTKKFYKPVALGISIELLYILTGKIAYSVYALDVITKLTGSESAAYLGMLILDGITVLGMCVGCGLVKFINRRTLLFTSSISAIVCMCIFSLYLYLISLSVIKENVYLSIVFLLIYSMAVSCGPLILSTSICSELLPVENRTYAMIILSEIEELICGVILKMAPLMFYVFQMHGSFLFFGLATAIDIFILFLYLPETKDKTLLEIASFMTETVEATVDEGKR